ncbi:uncharacterized protein LOC110451882 isoform X2 [Mizuhopecten yessoensis]|nr:uncharacterized protein LOC110451882 isoform X2 [Mizuhopecten yessoensis]XP_021355777.1 uncharacterized protein LOC110451882 isoform X2 [Mizuhopecten yessoensis]
MIFTERNQTRRSRMPEDTKLGMHPYSAEGCQIPQLPTLSIDTMTLSQLRDLIPCLLSSVRGKAADLAGTDAKPDWWPSDIPWSDTKTDITQQETVWTEMLRNVVRSCYKHMGQESSLRSKVQAKTRSSQSFPVLQSYLQHAARVKPGKGKKSNARPYAEIYVCFFCEKEFQDRSEMRQHQEKCVERPPSLQVVGTPPRQMMSPQGPPHISPSPKLLFSEKNIRPSKDLFIGLINLVPQKKAERIRAKHRYSQEIDCEKIDLDEPMSPTTPRTPKSLISQLSRDDSAATSKKRLSYSEPVDNSDRESVASGSCEEGEGGTVQKGKSLLSIDLSSLLGQRIQKHIHTESGLLVIPNAEQFCKTPVKNDTLGKLRHRVVTFPVTYKARKKYVGNFTHEYTFSSRQKRDRYSRVKTGLNKSSQMLLKSLPQCKVSLERLNNNDLWHWMSRYMYNKLKGIKSAVVEEEAVFPKEPLLMSKEIDNLLGLKRRSGSHSNPPLSLANVVSEQVNAEASKQKLTLYRCLLSDISSYSTLYGNKDFGPKSAIVKGNKNVPTCEKGRQCNLKSQQTNKEFVLPENPSPLFNSVELPVFTKSRSDDEFSIISMSSDEESLKSGCCIECRRRKRLPPIPDTVFRSPSLSPLSSPNTDSKARLVRSATLPVNMPLQINPYASSTMLRSPDISPCSCLSSPGSEYDHRIYPSPTSSTKSGGVLSTGSNKLNVKGFPSPVKHPSLGHQSEFRRTRSTSAFTDNVCKLESLLTACKTEEAGTVMSLRNSKSSSPAQDIVLPPSPSSCPSPGSSKDGNGYSLVSPVRDMPSSVESLSAQRRILRASRSESPGVSIHTQSESPKKTLGLPTLRVLLKSSGMNPKKDLILSLSDFSPCTTSPSKSVEPTRRSKRILSTGSPGGSPAKLRKLETR